MGALYPCPRLRVVLPQRPDHRGRHQAREAALAGRQLLLAQLRAQQGVGAEERVLLQRLGLAENLGPERVPATALRPKQGKVDREMTVSRRSLTQQAANQVTKYRRRRRRPPPPRQQQQQQQKKKKKKTVRKYNENTTKNSKLNPTQFQILQHGSAF